MSCLLKKPAFGVWPCGSCERNCKRKAFRFLRFQQELKSRQLQSDTLQALYPEGKALTLSASALNEYYKHQYAFYLRYVLGLQEDETIRPDARSHGNFLHRIFERVLKDSSDQAFDQRLSEAIRETSQEAEFQQLYGENGETEFIRNLLLDTAKTTGVSSPSKMASRPLVRRPSLVEAPTPLIHCPMAGSYSYEARWIALIN